MIKGYTDMKTDINEFGVWKMFLQIMKNFEIKQSDELNW